jgi:hypothetical protein
VDALNTSSGDFVYYESIKRELKIRPIHECRCDERLKTKAEESTRLAYTGLLGELQHPKTRTRLIDEKFVSVMGECVFVKL